MTLNERKEFLNKEKKKIEIEKWPNEIEVTASNLPQESNEW